MVWTCLFCSAKTSCTHSWEDKLSSGLVDSIWLQIGSDLEALRAGLEFLRDAAGDIRIYGSVFVPSRQLLSRTGPGSCDVNLGFRA